jgi:uncharacterized membrane protein
MDTTPAPVTPTEIAAPEDKTVAIVSYLTLIGFIIAVVMHGNKKTKLGAFHLRQGLGLLVTGLAGGIALMIIPVIGWIISPLFWLAMFVLWVIGLIGAANGQMKLVPLVGEHYQKWFAKTFE